MELHENAGAQRDCCTVGKKKTMITGRTFLSSQTGVLSCNQQEIKILGIFCLGMQSLNLCDM